MEWRLIRLHEVQLRVRRSDGPHLAKVRYGENDRRCIAKEVT